MGIHSIGHIAKSIIGNAEFRLTDWNRDAGQLFVVNLHGTQKKFLNNFSKQVQFLSERFSVISPSDLNDFYSGKLADNGPYLLFTFDDGIKNNLYAAEILEKKGIRAFFFVIPAFINEKRELQKTYFRKFIRPHTDDRIDSRDEDFTAMSWEELKHLYQAGHMIGSHTMTHTLVAEYSSAENSRHEIFDSRLALMSATGINDITAFCSINNTLTSVGKKEMKMIRENYIWHFTTIPGRNLPGGERLFIRRSNIESHWLPGAMKYALGKWDLPRWKQKEESMHSLLLSS